MNCTAPFNSEIISSTENTIQSNSEIISEVKWDASLQSEIICGAGIIIACILTIFIIKYTYKIPASLKKYIFTKRNYVHAKRCTNNIFFHEILKKIVRYEISKEKKQLFFLFTVLVLMVAECICIFLLKCHFNGHSAVMEISFSALCSIIAAVFFWMIAGYIYTKIDSSILQFKSFFNCKNKNNIYLLFSNAIGYARSENNNYEFEDGLCSFIEIRSINKINETLSKHPSKSFDIAKGLVDSIWEASMPSIVTDVSAFNKDGVASEIDRCIFENTDSIIVVGSTNKNSHRRYYYTDNNDCGKKFFMKFPWENIAHSRDEFFEEEKLKKNVFFNRVRIDAKVYSFFGKYNIAIIEKFYTDDHKTIFFCAGVRADDSLMAVNYLFKNWRELYEKYDKKYPNGYGICIGAEFSPTLRTQFDSVPITELMYFYLDSDGKIQPEEKNGTIHHNASNDNMVWSKLYTKIEEELFISTEQLKKISESFTKAICERALNKNSTLSLIDSCFTLPSGKESGEFVALDFGGTNIRANTISLFGDKSYRTAISIEETLENILGKKKNMSAYLFFNAVAKMLEKITYTYCQYKLGHTFSFPCNQTSCNNATLIKWTKEIGIRNAVNKDINKILASSLRRSGINNIEPTAIINDTIGVLLAKAYTSGNVSIGSICGTGHNSAFFDAKGRAINLESGNFESDELRAVMTVYDDNIPGQAGTSGQLFEKMVSGAYIPKLFNAILDKLQIEYTDDSRRNSAQGVAELALDISHSNGLIASIAQDLFIRSARLIAASYHGIIRYLDPKFQNNHVIAIDGSLFCKNIIFSSSLHKAINELFDKDAAKIQLVPCHDFSALGSAVAAAMAVTKPLKPKRV